jgi:hypothetical protein
MARGKLSPHAGGDFIPAPTPGSRLSAAERSVYESAVEAWKADPDPRAYMESIKRTHPLQFLALVLQGGRAIALDDAAEAGTPASSSRLPAAVSPIRPRIVTDVPSDA